MAELGLGLEDFLQDVRNMNEEVYTNLVHCSRKTGENPIKIWLNVVPWT